MKRRFTIKEKFNILLGVNIFIAFVLIFILPEFLEPHIHIGHVTIAVGIGISTIIIELPIIFMILISDKDKDN